MSPVLMRMLIVSLVVAGCGQPVTASGKPSGTPCSSDLTLTYDNFGRAFLESYCLRCHSATVMGEAREGAPSSHNLDKVTDVRSLATHIDEYSGAGPEAVNTRMPPTEPRPSIEERRQLAKWLACDAP